MKQLMSLYSSMDIHGLHQKKLKQPTMYVLRKKGTREYLHQKGAGYEYKETTNGCVKCTKEQAKILIKAFDVELESIKLSSIPKCRL